MKKSKECTSDAGRLHRPVPANSADRKLHADWPRDSVTAVQEKKKKDPFFNEKTE